MKTHAILILMASVMTSVLIQIAICDDAICLSGYEARLSGSFKGPCLGRGVFAPLYTIPCDDGCKRDLKDATTQREDDLYGYCYGNQCWCCKVKSNSGDNPGVGGNQPRDLGECSSDADCQSRYPGTKEICQSTLSTTRCAMCDTDIDCQRYPSRYALPACQRTTGLCRQCSDDTHCTNPNLPRCVFATFVCGECRTASDCVGERFPTGIFTYFCGADGYCYARERGQRPIVPGQILPGFPWSGIGILTDEYGSTIEYEFTTADNGEEVALTDNVGEVTPTDFAEEVTLTDEVGEVTPTDIAEEVTLTDNIGEVTPTDIAEEVTLTDNVGEVTPTDIAE